MPASGPAPGTSRFTRAATPAAAHTAGPLTHAPQTSVVFTLPTTYPVTATSANYTSALVAFVLAVGAVQHTVCLYVHPNVWPCELIITQPTPYAYGTLPLQLGALAARIPRICLQRWCCAAHVRHHAICDSHRPALTLTFRTCTHVLLTPNVPQLASFLFYAPGFGGRHWFTGPAPNLD